MLNALSTDLLMNTALTYLDLMNPLQTFLIGLS